MKLRPSSKITYFSWKVFLWIGALHVLSLAFMFQYFTWSALAAGVAMFYISGMCGITFCFHRLLTHRSFKAPVWLENVTAVCGTFACQGGPVSWVGEHRVHHAFSDKEEDPHNSRRGFWYSHFLWLLERRADMDQFDEVKHYAPDIAKRKFFVWLDHNMIVVQWMLGAVLFAIGGLVGAQKGFDYSNAWGFIVWGVFVRLVAVYHVTWLVNSAAHLWGSRPHQGSNDYSTNSWIVGLLAFGEGWHNNHHFQQRSARHGWKWWQFDMTWILIRTLESMNIIWDVKRPVLKSAAIRNNDVSLLGDDSLPSMQSSSAQA